MKSKRVSVLAVAAGVILASWATRPLHDPAWRAMRGSEGSLGLVGAEDALGQGVTIALLGGFRSVAADFLWLRMNSAWENRDLPVTQSLVRVVTSLDPRPLYFWINGARIVAYDMPAWRIDAAGGYEAVPPTVQRRFDQDQATVALNLLERAMRFHPDHPLLLIEMANIQQRRMGNLAEAAELYRRAALQPGAPFFAARIHGELLRRMGRERDAYQWLRGVYATLPMDDPMAAPEVVLGRLRELEEKLGVADGERVRERQGAAP